MAASALLAGCAAGPDYRAPTLSELKVAERFAAAPPATAADEDDLARWWRAFDDPALTGLVERGLAANLDIDEAGARVREARANLWGARGALLPGLGASGSAARAVGGPIEGDRTRFQVGFDAAYEVDVFGGVRRSVEAARATAQGAEASLRSVQLTVASEIALNYFAAREAQTRLRIARETLAALDETVEIVGWRRQAGLVGALDLERARQIRDQTAATIPSLETDYAAAANRLAVLLGEAPGAVAAALEPARDAPAPPGALPAAIPADVVRRRPDVALAERTLAAETARIGVQAAQLYPALTLSGSFSGSGTSISDAANDLAGDLIAGITAPIFHGGQIRAAVEAQRASAAAALAAYRTAVLTALEESENALTSVSATRRRRQSLASAETAARNAVEIARAQYRSGLIDFQSLLESERTLLSSQDSLASARVAEAAAAVQLYKALGGGWQAAPTPSSVSAPGARQGEVAAGSPARAGPKLLKIAPSYPDQASPLDPGRL
ncbi:efflux transporter outer membrane subunit [Phenylobacterium sp.]|uniref:efflux transporter outer membrane subunit n=1 Tax=Phenylobacterium sp. TaxID=1871053 RepID=UPI003947A151